MNNCRTVNCARQICLRFLVTPWLATIVVTSSEAAEGKWSGSTEVAYVTDYLWRGAKLAGDSIQPSLSTTYSDRLTLGIAGTYGLKKDSPLDPNGNGRYGETNYIGTYTISQNAFSLTLGGTVYGIDDLQDPDTGKKFKYYFESLASISLRTKFNPTLTFWREFGRLQTNYLEFSLSHFFELNKQCRLSLRPHIGVYENSQRYFGADVAVNYEFGDGLYGRALVTLIKNNYPGVRHEHVNFSVGTGKRW